MNIMVSLDQSSHGSLLHHVAASYWREVGPSFERLSHLDCVTYGQRGSGTLQQKCRLLGVACCGVCTLAGRGSFLQY